MSAAEYPKTEERDGMRITWDQPIEMDDGIDLRCDVYRPRSEGTYPVVMTHGPYGKWLHFEDLNPDLWEHLRNDPELPSDTTNKYQVWETVDPEVWVPDGYVVVRVDSRGAGRSPGYLDVWSDRETRDFADCIEWAGEQPWSNGRVGLLGISYYAMNQWQVAARRPDHLAAICPWEGAADFYRDAAHHGGIYTTWSRRWYERQPVKTQHGLGANGYRSRLTGDWVAGPETLTEEELGSNRADLESDFLDNKLATDEYWTSRTADLSKIEVPLLAVANWGGHGLHNRGGFEGFKRAGSNQKWLEVHGALHLRRFYTRESVSLQKQFFGRFLKDEDTGWNDRPRVHLNVRRPGDVSKVRGPVRVSGEEKVDRSENSWPLESTEWTGYYLHPESLSLDERPPTETSSKSYRAFGDGLTFLTAPFEDETEFTGPISTKLFVSSDTEDADVFVVLRAFKPDMGEIAFQGAVEPHKAVGLGWLRASHRKLDEERSTEWRPYHTHDERQLLTPGDVYELGVEIWPSSIVVPEGYRIGFSIRGHDYRYPNDVESRATRPGVGNYLHDESKDRPADIFGGDVTIHSGPDLPSSVTMPLITDR